MQTNDDTSATTGRDDKASAMAFLLPGDSGQPVTSAVTVCPIGEAGPALFVDDDTGCDASGDGSPQRPFASLRGALAAAASHGVREVYIATGPHRV